MSLNSLLIAWNNTRWNINLYEEKWGKRQSCTSRWPRTSASETSALCFLAQAATNELEMQNDVLSRAQAELDVQARYFDLYDLAQYVYVATHGLQSALQNIK